MDLERLSKEDRGNLQIELRIHRKLRHANIIRFYDCLQVERRVYALLEYAANGCLFFYVNPQTGLPERLALRFLYQTALGVSHLHAQNIAHRDIKPENLLFDEEFNVKLCDFGWATTLAADRPSRRSVCGTYEYMSPEVAYERPHDTKTDIWCLGILLYEMLHGRSPFRAGSLEEMRRELAQKRIEIASSLSPHTKSLLKALLVGEPARRPTATAVLAHPALAAFTSPLRLLDERETALLATTFLLNTRGAATTSLPDVVLRQRARGPQSSTEGFFAVSGGDFFGEVPVELGREAFPRAPNRFRSANSELAFRCPTPPRRVQPAPHPLAQSSEAALTARFSPVKAGRSDVPLDRRATPRGVKQAVFVFRGGERPASQPRAPYIGERGVQAVRGGVRPQASSMRHVPAAISNAPRMGVRLSRGEQFPRTEDLLMESATPVSQSQTPVAHAKQRELDHRAARFIAGRASGEQIGGQTRYAQYTPMTYMSISSMDSPAVGDPRGFSLYASMAAGMPSASALGASPFAQPMGATVIRQNRPTVVIRSNRLAESLF